MATAAECTVEPEPTGTHSEFGPQWQQASPVVVAPFVLYYVMYQQKGEVLERVITPWLKRLIGGRRRLKGSYGMNTRRQTWLVLTPCKSREGH